MLISDLKNKLVAVLGFGLEGRAVAEYLLKHGVKPVLFDEQPWQMWPAADKRHIKALKVNFIFGPDAFKELAGFDVIFRSPGISLDKFKPDNKAIITSQTKWFFENCPAKIIGVTGTKGKGTTASLIYKILQATHYQLPTTSYLTGNIGKIQPLEILDKLKAKDLVVFELSSFQLLDLTASPYIGVVLMITSEHLDYHKNRKEYIEAKAAIVKYQTRADCAIYNMDFPASAKVGKLGKGRKRSFSTKSDGTDCYVKNGLIYAKINGSTAVEPLIKTSDLQLKGEHNLQNACAAILAADSAGASKKAILGALKKFKGLEHRLEFVAKKKGIKFYNDSFSTTPETAIAAINSFSEPLVLILGGSSKKSDFKALGDAVRLAKNIKSLILIGEEAGRIKTIIGRTGAEIFQGAKNMAEIFKQIKQAAKKGDVVLLSPACASFDMFKNYKDRGAQFKKLARGF